MYTPGAEQLIIVPATIDAPSPCAVMSFARGKPAFDARFAGRRTPTGYVMEGCVKPRPGVPFRLRGGVRFGLDVAVDDADTNAGNRKSQMALHGTANNCNDTSHWGRYQLRGAEAKPTE